MSVTVHSVRADDRRAWAAMRAALWPEASPDEHAAEMAAYSERADQICFIAREDERAVGFAEASIRRDPVNGCDTSPVGFLEAVYVAPERRRAGVARCLLTAVEQWTAGRGCIELGSDADQRNAHGHAFHIGSGFDERERVVFYRKRVGRVVDALGLEPRTR